MRNKEKIKAWHRENYEKNKEKINEKHKEYQIKNKEKLLEKRTKSEMIKKRQEYDRQLWAKNKEKIKEKQKEYRSKKNIERNENYVKRFSWKDSESTRKYFEYAAKLLHINELSDWYRISRSQILQTSGNSFIILDFFSIIKSLSFFLNYCYYLKKN